MGLRSVLIIAIILVQSVFSQENAGTNVAPALVKCYDNILFATRDYRLPSTITTLIDLIRKIEDASPTQNAKQLSIQILQRFRQDGIRRTHKDIDVTLGLPYSPKGWEAYKNRIQLLKLTPGDAITFNNNSLTDLEGCSLHYMISSSTETNERGDESTVCNRIARYTSRIQKREAEFTDVSSHWTRSSCPIESGVVYTKWGAVKAGLVLAGIASGLEPNPIRTQNGTVDSIYASTIAGELSEVALNQAITSKIIGNKGSWNSTLVPKYYFLEKSDNNYLYLTDAEIRGGLDGLFLGLQIDKIKSKFSNIKISQILDLYYGRGILNDTTRACNRVNLLSAIISDDMLLKQTILFNYILDEVSQYSYSPKKGTFPILAQNSVNSFNSYWKSNLNDLACSADENVIERVATDVVIFIDIAWDYNKIQPFLSHILQNIDVNKYESSYTIFDGVNCNIIVNKSRSSLDFYEYYNLTQHQQNPTGFDYQKVVNKAEDIFKRKLDNETDLTGQSSIILMLPHNTPSSSQVEYIRNRRLNLYKNYYPDLRILVVGAGTKSSYDDLVFNSDSDVITLSDNSDESSIKDAARSVVNRLKKIPRSVVNPKCGSSFSSDSTSFEVFQYVEPSGVNYHKISPNYFYEGNTLKMKGQGFGTLIVCTSRNEANPRANSTGANCKSIDSDEISIDISEYCIGDSPTDCSPIYISVEGSQSRFRCNEKLCRFPDSIKYSISLEGVKCASSAVKLFNSLALILLLFALMRF